MSNYKVAFYISLSLNIFLIITLVGMVFVTYWFWSLGNEMVQKETQCNNYCTDLNAKSYYSDGYNEICYCFYSNDDYKEFTWGELDGIDTG